MGSAEFEKKRQRNASGESTVSAESVSHYIPTPPDGGWGWVVVFASFVNHIIVDGLAFTFGVFYMEFLRAFNAGKGKTALVGSLLCGCYLMTGPIAGALTNKFGCRAVCMTGSLFAAASFVLCTFSPNIEMLMITYGVMAGIGLGLIYLPSIIAVSYYFEKRRALATGIAVCGAGVGTFIFAPVGGVLLDVYDWKNAMLIVAAVVLNGIVTGLLFRPLDPPKRHRRPRSKNIFDRLKEQAASSLLKGNGHRESLSVEPTPSKKDSLLRGLQEVKLERLRALQNEESEFGGGSCPNSAVSSLHRLDRMGSTASGDSSMMESPSRQNSMVESPSGQMPTIVLEVENDGDTSHMPPANGNIPKENGKIPGSDVNNQAGDSQPLLRTGVPNHNGNGYRNSMPDPAVLLANGNTPSPTVKLLLPDDHQDSNSRTKSRSTGDVFSVQKRPRFLRPDGVQKEDYARPMYRKDIFYSGSILHMPQFQSQPDVKHYIKSITSIPGEVPPEKESKIWRCLRLPKAVKDTLKEMLDISILKDPVFVIVGLANIFGMVGLFVPFVFIAERAIALGVTDTRAAFLLSVMGITNTLGRILAGWMADFRCVNPLLIHNLGLLLGGAACIANMFCTSYPLMCTFAAFFGFCVAAWITMTSIILCNLCGLEKLTNAYGLLTLIRGVSSVAGPPVAGLVFDATANFDASFHIGGAMLLTAGLISCLLHHPYFTRRREEMRDLRADVMTVTPTDAEIPLPWTDDEDEDDEMAPPLVGLA